MGVLEWLSWTRVPCGLANIPRPDQAVVEDPVVSLLDLVTAAGVSSHWFVISVCRAGRLAEFDVECCNLWCCF